MQGYTKQQAQTMTTGPSTSGQPVIVYVVNQSDAGCSSKYTHYNHKAAAILGGLQLFLGVASVVTHSSVLGIGTYKTMPLLYYIFHGIWIPTFWFIAGGFGLASAATKTRCTIITTMVMSIISAVTIIPFIGLQSSVVAQFNNYSGYLDYSDDKEKRNIIYGLSILLLIVCLAEGVVTIVASALCCKAVCCCNPTVINVQNTTTNGVTQAIPLQTTAPPTLAPATAPPYAAQAQDKDKSGLVGHLVAPASGVQPDQPPAYSM